MYKLENLPSEVIRHILSFLGVEDHIRFSFTCKTYYKNYKIIKIESSKEAQKHYNNIGCYTVFRGCDITNITFQWVVSLDVSKYTGITKYVKELIIRSFHECIDGDTIQYIPGSLTGDGLKYLVKLYIDGCFSRCTISNLTFEKLITLQAYYCDIIGCKFNALENLDLDETRFLSRLPKTLKTLSARNSRFSKNCAKWGLENLEELIIYSYDFIQHAPYVKKATLYDVRLYNLPQSLEDLSLIDSEVHGEEFYLPKLRRLHINRSIVDGLIVAPKVLELNIRKSEVSALAWLGS